MDSSEKINHKATLNKQERSEYTVTEGFTRNRFTPLAEIPTDAEDTRSAIPVIVNGLISVKGRVKKTNKSISQNNPIIHGVPNLKMPSAITNVNLK